MPDWFRDLFAEHVQIALALNWNRNPPDYGLAAKALWREVERRRFSGKTDICPVGQIEGRGHSLAWVENEVYGNPKDGGLWTCYDCRGRRYTKMNGEFVEWTAP